MDTVIIGLLFGGGTLITSITTSAITTWFSGRAERRAEHIELVQEVDQQAELVVQRHKAMMQEEGRTADRRIHARVDGVEARLAEQILIISKDLAEMKGMLRAIEVRTRSGYHERD